MDAEKALGIIQKKKPGTIPHMMMEFEDFYLFDMVPLGTSDEALNYTGTIFSAVSKDDGSVFEYDITTDLESFERAERII